MCKFKIGDKVTLNPKSQWARNAENPLNVVGVICSINPFGEDDEEFDCEVEWGNSQFNYYNSEEDLLPHGEPTLYTKSELNEIEELRDRVEYLESLCEDYAKVIVEKDARISYLLSQLNNRSDNYDVYGYVNGVK